MWTEHFVAIETVLLFQIGCHVMMMIQPDRLVLPSCVRQARYRRRNSWRYTQMRAIFPFNGSPDYLARMTSPKTLLRHGFQPVSSAPASSTDRFPTHISIVAASFCFLSAIRFSIAARLFAISSCLFSALHPCAPSLARILWVRKS